MAKKKYVKSYSNYVLKQNPSTTKSGVVYENDLVTTSDNYNSVNNNQITSTEGVFTFVTTTTPDNTKDYNTSGYTYNTFTFDTLTTLVSDSDFTSVDNSSSKKTVKNIKNVELNKGYDKLSDFTYYGSSVELIESSINDIIANFPAAIYILTANTGQTLVLKSGVYENPFSIDTFNYYASELSTLTYSLNTMATSYLDYELITTGGTYISDITGFTGYTTMSSDVCFGLNKINHYDGQLFIRPKKEKIDNFYKNLNDFQKNILNQNSYPKNKTILKVPSESDDGVIFNYYTFTWPTSDGYNLEINSSAFNNYLADFSDYGTLIDNYYSDNLYRSLTHDSIKNMDHTYDRVIDELDLDNIITGTTKIKKLIRLYGRQFDELKKYIEGISYANTITYNGLNNLPQAYFDNRVNMCGWDNIFFDNILQTSGQTSSNLFSGMPGIFTMSDVYYEYLKRLIINTKHIFRSKGTIKSIRKLLGLLGYENDWFVIRNYSQKIDSFLQPTELLNIAQLNYTINPESIGGGDGKDDFNYSFDEGLFDKINVGIFAKCPTCGGVDYIISGETYSDGNTAICTIDGTIFDLTGNTYGYPRPISNTSDYYFQQKGRWYRETGGWHTDLTGGTYVDEIYDGNNPHIGGGYPRIYDGFYDNGYDYIDQFRELFKRHIISAQDNTDGDVQNYIGYGFTTENALNFSNNKINYVNNTFSDENSSLWLNSKNFVIGIDGDRVLQSFFNNNSGITNYNIISGTSITLDGTLNLININNISGTTGNTTISINIPFNTGVTSVKIYNNISGNSSNVNIVTPQYSILPGQTALVYNVSGVTTISRYRGNDEYAILSGLTLPYLEQIIPSTAIFDFVLIDETESKWLLVDQYCERDSNGYYTGYKILVYQNINYFSSGGTDLQYLYNQILRDFGSGYTEYSQTVSDIYLISEDGEYLLMEDGNFSISEKGDVQYGSVMKFKMTSTDCGLDTTPNWLVNTGLT